MKPKSMKLRMLVILHAIYKYTDENHRLNSRKLNKHLKPYDLECTARALTSTIDAMRDFGMDVQSRGEWNHQGIWLNDRPLSGEKLQQLIFAITTNPFFHKVEADLLLEDLVPLVTVYQEPSLVNYVKKEKDSGMTAEFYAKYAVIQEAIALRRRVRYTIRYLKYEKESKSLTQTEEWPTLFTPKRFYQNDGKLYMFGYNNTDKRMDLVDLESIGEIKLAFKHKDPKEKEVQELLKTMDFQDVTEHPNRNGTLIYSGDAIFRCRGQYAKVLHAMFGPTKVPIEKDERCRCVYTVKNARIDSKTLTALADIPNHDIRIIGPEALVTAVRDYYSSTADILLNPSIIHKKQQT